MHDTSGRDGCRDKPRCSRCVLDALPHRGRHDDDLPPGSVRALGVFSDTALLRMWSIATPRAIFPNRKFGTASGDKASFLVLDGNPLGDWPAVRRIRLRVKEGIILP